MDSLDASGKYFDELFLIEAAARNDLLGLSQRLGTNTASQTYLQMAPAMARIAHFPQALRYASRVASYEDKLLAASSMVLGWKQFESILGTEYLDFVADWGNQYAEDARRRWDR